ncbi:MAG: amidohydrolase family protein, partial [Proteobacteria bacterium]|nr:amidohydrolase family protein [Pseudomonadota bacterium]
MRFSQIYIVLTVTIFGLVACSESPRPAAVIDAVDAIQESSSVDWVLTNGQILTVDAEFSVVEAMAIDDGKIIATGSDAEIAGLAGTETKLTNLAGQTVVPGLIDNHMHFVRSSKQWYREVRLDSVKSRVEALALLALRASELPEGEWVVVNGGWIFAQFQDNSELFTAAELDAAVPNTPVYIQEAYSRAFLNSAALNAAGVTKNTVLEGRGSIQKDAEGNLTGELVGGAAMGLVTAHIPAVSDAVWDSSLLATTQGMHKMGLTTVYDVGGNTVTPEFYNAVERIADRGDLTMRVFYSLNGQNSPADSAEDIIAAMQNNNPDNESLRFAQFGYGEQVYQPMRAGPARPGSAPWELSDEHKEDYRNILIAAIDNGWQTNEHSHVDAKIQTTLSVLEEINQTRPVGELRMTIAHANG